MSLTPDLPASLIRPDGKIAFRACLAAAREQRAERARRAAACPEWLHARHIAADAKRSPVERVKAICLTVRANVAEEQRRLAERRAYEAAGPWAEPLSREPLPVRPGEYADTFQQWASDQRRAAVA